MSYVEHSPPALTSQAETHSITGADTIRHITRFKAPVFIVLF
jgi:hypothetical protein